MSPKSLKIPFGFLITGILWAIFSDPLITTFTRNINIDVRDSIRSFNDFIFVGIISVTLYFQIKKQHRQLVASKEQYRRLFELNPNPMWIYRSEDLCFVKVNQAAIDLYGYSMTEFLSMTIKDIRSTREKGKLEEYIRSLRSPTRKSSTWNHLKKSGELLHVAIVSYDLDFDGQPCCLVMVNNITELVQNQEKVKAQNNTLQEIAWSNSHEVRRALCSVISLVDLLKTADSADDREQYIILLEKCSNEIDDMIKEANKKVELLQNS